MIILLGDDAAEKIYEKLNKKLNQKAKNEAKSYSKKQTFYSKLFEKKLFTLPGKIVLFS